MHLQYSADSPIWRSKYKLFVISEQIWPLAPHTLSKLGKKVRGYVISRSKIRELQKILARFKKNLAQKVEEILIEKNLGRSTNFQIETFSVGILLLKLLTFSKF